MSRVSRVEDDTASEAARAEIARQIEKNGRITNMKRTLLHSLPAYHAYMEWYTLRDQLEPVIGSRAIILYSHAISNQTDCLICSTFFRRYLIDAGEDPANLTLNDTESLLVEYGQQLARNAHDVSDELFARLRARFSEAELVLLTAFAGLMIATNLFNNALRIPLDDYLSPYRDTEKFGVDT